jgi:sphingomyelin phosphodiesterase
MCGVLLGAQCFSGNSKNLNWKIEIPTKPDNQLKKKFKIGKTSKVNEQKVYKIIQLTDIHLDDKYLKDTEAECGEPLCCRDSNNNIKRQSGYWGTYPCDLPNSTLHNALSEIANNVKDVDLWYLTGDDIAHDIWAYDKKNTVKIMKYINHLVKGSTNKTVIPAVGNHEAVPSNWFVTKF